MSAHARNLVAIRQPDNSDRAIETAYNQAGDKYIAYADGDPTQLYAFDGQYAYGDRCIWETLFARLCSLRASGARTISILDMGCGPGTWLRRVVARARAVGFRSIVARGFDLAGEQVRRARELSADLAGLPGVKLTFEIGDIHEPLPEADASVDLCLCLCGVLNHLPAKDLPAVFAEVSRVTRGTFITTARTIGSTPSVYVDEIRQARQFRQDNRNNRLDVEFQNGRHISLPSHLFSAAELRSLISPHFEIEDLCGIDLFHARFSGDPRWNPPGIDIDGRFSGELDQLERQYCRDEGFVDHATHLLLVGRSRKAASASNGRARWRP